MYTSSAITWKNPEGFYEYRYHHSDSHLRGVGETLLTRFSDKKDVAALFGLQRNFVSILKSEKEYNQNPKSGNWPNGYRQHIKLACRHVIYFKDYVVAKPVKSKTTFFKDHSDSGYLYFFDSTANEPKWLCSLDCDQKKNPLWLPLKEAVTLLELVDKINHDATPPNDIVALVQQIKQLSDTAKGYPAWADFYHSSTETCETLILIEDKKETAQKLGNIAEETNKQKSKRIKI